MSDIFLLQERAAKEVSPLVEVFGKSLSKKSEGMKAEESNWMYQT